MSLSENRLNDLKELLEEKFEDDITKMTAKDRLTIYLNLMEFFVPKMQRSNFQIEDDQDKEIIIKHYGSNGNQEL
jgi:hypothetical protein